MMNIYVQEEERDFPGGKCQVPETPEREIPEWETQDQKSEVPAIIRVIGAGGGGSNAVNRMIDCGLEGVEFIVVNTDIQDLRKSKAVKKIQIGRNLTGGRGAGGKPEKGEMAANENRDLLVEAVKGADMVFVAACMGGGTGTGSAPVIARAAKEAEALTIGIVTKPFDSEGAVKMRLAEEGIKKMREVVDTLIIIPNQHIFEVVEGTVPITQAYLKADEILRQGVQGISDLITQTGIVNVDFADVESTMKGQGDALMGIACGSGENRAKEATAKAMENPLLEDASIEGATHILISITGSEELSLVEVDEALKTVRAKADPEVEVIYGINCDSSLGDKIRITVIATGFPAAAREEGKSKGDFINIDEWKHLRNRSQGTPGFLSRRTTADLDLDTPPMLRDGQLDFDGADEKKPAAGKDA
jgi:cell division protein FtsZ